MDINLIREKIKAYYPKLCFEVLPGCAMFESQWKDGLFKVCWKDGPSEGKFNAFWNDYIKKEYPEAELTSCWREYSPRILEFKLVSFSREFKWDVFIVIIKDPHLGEVGRLCPGNSVQSSLQDYIIADDILYSELEKQNFEI